MMKVGIALIGCLLLSCAGRASLSDSQRQHTTQKALAAAQSDPNNPDLWIYLAELYTQQDSFARAAQTLDKALDLRRGNPQAMYLKGAALYRMGEFTQAIALFKSVLYSPEHPLFCAKIGQVLGQPFHIVPLCDNIGDNAFPWPSPSQDEIVFQSNRDGNWEIYRQSLDKRQVQRLTFHNDRDESPVFSMDGESIYFTSTRNDTHKVGHSYGQMRKIYRLLGNGTIEQITFGPGDDWSPRISPNNKMMIYMHLKENQPGVAESKSQIMGIDLERRPYPRLLADTAGEKVLGGFEPNGDWIYYSESRADDYACRRISVSRPLEGHSCDLFCSAIGLYQWRDGKKWVYFRQNKGQFDIFLYDSASQKEARLTAWSTHEAFPVFSRDGRKIFFHSYRDKKYRLYAIDLDEAASRDELLLLLNELNKQPLQS
ncbi:MAG TPA: tetratricopeptide repeat protein [bacterium]|nr:tetratricopeptide repeat protein [bacterium]HPG46348.1 tetratricopeptide repeat protein [bacterium]HPM98458.1 tetratricopeptide repeat protein [bacterium]